MRKRWAIFISGTGSNMMAALDRQTCAQICLVVSSRENAYGLQRAKRRGIPTLVMDKNSSWDELLKILLKLNIDQILLAGFMRIIPSEFIEKWSGKLKRKIINVHPSLLPSYPGLRSIERAFNDGKNSGVTIHIVTEGVDEGPILMQQSVPLEEDLVTTEFMVHVQEHRLVRKALEI